MSKQHLSAWISAIALGAVFAVVEPTALAADPPTEEQLDELLKAYKLYELPLPPKDAPLVRYPTEWRTVGKDGEQILYALGFELATAKKGDPAKCFSGTGQIRVLARNEVAKRVDPKPEALKGIDSLVNVELAVHCYARGWTGLATAILEKSRIDPQGGKRFPEADLAHSAWVYWSEEFRRPETDRREVAKFLKIILKHRSDDFGVGARRLLSSLDLSLLPGKGKPGTVEALVDDLRDATSTHRSGMMEFTPEVSPIYLKLARQGFDAIPTLIEHLRDERLTRAFKEGFNNFQGYNYRIGDMVCDLLQGLAGNDVGKDWLRRQQGYRLEKSDVEKWWADAKTVGEEKYFLSHVLGDDAKAVAPQRLMLEVIISKYPKHIPDIYRRMLAERPAMDGHLVAKAVAESDLTKQEKVDLLLLAGKSESLDRRQESVQQLRVLELTECVKLLIATLKLIPTTPAQKDKTNYWNESYLADLVVELNDPKAWAALEDTARRSPIRLRNELLKTVAKHGPKQAHEGRLRFMRGFLDDPQVWKSATYWCAVMLQMRKPTNEWTSQDWDELLEDVKTSLRREGIK